MKKGTVKRILASVILSILMLGLVACKDSQADPNRFDVKLKSGYGNSVEMGSYAPFYVEITNNGTDFEGAVQLIIPGEEGKNTMYQKDIAIAAGGTKTVELVGKIERITRQVKVNILNDKDAEIWSSLENCNTATDLENINVGILSDDYSALGYMDHKPLTANMEMTTAIYELTKDSMPSDWHALEMLDVIVISDFSTDALSEAQINALGVWVNQGGLLMVGTGSTSNKTLAALNNRLFEVKVGELESYQTKYGLMVADYTYNYGYENSYNNPYGDSLYATFFEENYDSLRAEFEEAYMEQFKIDYYYDDSYYTWDEYWEDSFYWYCYDNFYASYLVSIGENGGNYAAAEEMPFVKADVLELSGEAVKEGTTTVFWGETENGDVYELAYVLPQGEGYVLLSGVDFTKTPLSNYAGNSQLFIHWVETLIGQKCYEDAYDYGSSSYTPYSEKQIFQGAVTAKVPPILIYLGILLGYVIAVLVIYLVHRKKKKTTNLWIVYPAVAGGLTLLIFCIGFSTRIYRPTIGAITLITPNGSMSAQRTYTAVTVPDNKAYEVGFSPEQSVEYDNFESSYYYNNADEIQWDNFEVGYIYNYESVDVVLGEHEAMANVFFRLDTVCADQRNVIVNSEGGNLRDITVTNEYGCDLESALLIADNDLYIIGDMESGETVTFSSMTKYDRGTIYNSYNYSVPNLGGVMYEDESWKILLGLVFGSASSAYDDYLCRYRALNAVTDYADNYDNSGVVFMALPTESTAMPIQTSTNYNERRIELIYIEYDLSAYQGGN